MTDNNHRLHWVKYVVGKRLKELIYMLKSKLRFDDIASSHGLIGQETQIHQ